MRSKTLSAACIVLAGPALASVLAGCGQHASAAAGRLPPSVTTANQPSGHPAKASSGLRSKTGADQSPASRTAATASGAAANTRGSGGSPLVGGLYADAPSDIPHYVFSLASDRPETVHGSVTFIYQDGRADTIGEYTGRLSAGGRLTFLFSNGRQLSGTYRAGHLTLANCSSVLTWARQPSYCQFTYGDTP
jgi:hypothetical protein